MAADDLDFRTFVAARSTALLRTAFLLTGDRHLAEDLLQTALLKSYLRWGRIRDPGAAEAYVRVALVRCATSMFRRRWWGERPTEPIPDVSISDSSALFAERDAVLGAMLRLPKRQRAVIVLRYYEDLSEAQIADLLGCSAGTVKAHASRAMTTLRALLAPEADEGPRLER